MAARFGKDAVGDAEARNNPTNSRSNPRVYGVNHICQNRTWSERVKNVAPTSATFVGRSLRKNEKAASAAIGVRTTMSRNDPTTVRFPKSASEAARTCNPGKTP